MSDIKGKCHCGNCTYSVNSEKKFEFLCHCVDCKVLNGGGHLSGIIFEETGFAIEGKISIYAYSGGSGKNIEYSFCSQCGTGLYAKPLAHDGIVVIRANTLTDETIFSPKKSLFPESAHPWDNSIIS